MTPGVHIPGTRRVFRGGALQVLEPGQRREYRVQVLAPFVPERLITSCTPGVALVQVRIGTLWILRGLDALPLDRAWDERLDGWPVVPPGLSLELELHHRDPGSTRAARAWIGFWGRERDY